MAETRDHHVLVPSAEPGTLLAMGTREHPELPHATGRPGAAGALEAVRERFGLAAPYLRPAELVRGPDGTPVAALHELDAPDANWAPPDGVFWLAADDADPSQLAPAEFVPAIERWLAVLRGAPIPALRPPWARSGWFEAAAAWMHESSAALGLEPEEGVELVAQWPLSSVLRLQTRTGLVYFKAVFSLFFHEPAVTAVLSERHPELVPEVVAVDEKRGWMLMRELRGEPLGDQDVTHWVHGLRAMSRIHRSWVGQVTELMNVRAVDRTLAVLERDIAGLAATFDFEPEAHERLDAALPDLERLCRTLAAGPLPETLVHGDLHPWNFTRDGDDLRIFDWSDVCLAHPLFDLATFLPHTDDTSARETLVETYLETWADTAPLEELKSLADLAAPAAKMHHAISYVRILEALEPDDRWYFSEVPRTLVVEGLDLLEELRRTRSI